MKTTVSTKNLTAAVAAVKPFIPTRSILLILANVQIKAVGKRLEFHGTDLDCSIATFVDAKTGVAGETTAPIKRLDELLKGAKCEIKIEADDKNKLSVTSGVLTSSILGLPAEEYPRTPEVREDRKISMPQCELRRALKATRESQSTDESRYVLNGVYLEHVGGRVTVVTTDGKRLAMTTTAGTEGPQFSVIIPSDTVGKLYRLLGDTAESVEIAVQYRAASKQETEDKLAFTESLAETVRFAFTATIGKNGKAVQLPVVITSKPVGGMYPHYRQVIPNLENMKLRIELPRKQFQDNIAAVGRIVDRLQPSVKLLFKDNVLTISANNAEGDNSSTQMPLSGKLPKPLTIALNPEFLMDVCAANDTETIWIELQDELSPIRMSNGKDDSLYVIMPVRLN